MRMTSDLTNYSKDTSGMSDESDFPDATASDSNKLSDIHMSESGADASPSKLSALKRHSNATIMEEESA